MDRILLNQIKIWGHHGASAEEREVGQILTVDVAISRDLRQAGITDHLNDTADYGQVFQIVRDIISGGREKLLEMLAHKIALEILRLGNIDEVFVRVIKPNPPLGGNCESSAVEVVRTPEDLV